MANVAGSEGLQDPVVGLEEAMGIFRDEIRKTFPSSVDLGDGLSNVEQAIMYGMAARVSDEKVGDAVVFIAHREGLDGSLKPLVGKPLSGWRQLYGGVASEMAKRM